MIKRIVAYADGDGLAASRDFYVEVLGFQRVIGRLSRQRHGGRAVVTPASGNRIRLIIGTPDPLGLR